MNFNNLKFFFAVLAKGLAVQVKLAVLYHLITGSNVNPNQIVVGRLYVAGNLLNVQFQSQKRTKLVVTKVRNIKNFFINCM